MDKVKNLNEDKKDTKNAKKEAPARPFMTPPAGKPLPKHMVKAPNGKMMPQGKPMKKSDVPQTKPKEEAAPTEAEAKKPVEAVQPAAPAAAAEGKGAREAKETKTAEAAKEPVKEAAPKKEPAKPVTDYVDNGPTLKIVKRAVDIEKEEKEAREKAAAEKAARAAERAERPARRSDRPERSDRPRGDRSDRQDRGDRGDKKTWQKSDRPQGNKSGERSDRQDRGDRKPFDKGSRGGERFAKDKDGDDTDRRNERRNGGEKKKSVLVYDAPMGLTKSGNSSKKGNKDKDKERERLSGEKKHGKVMDLSKSAPKKHKKNKERVEQVEETAIEMEALPVGTKVITVPITVAGLAEQIEVSTSQIIMALMKLGIMANINQNLDEDTAVLLGADLGINIVVSKVNEEDTEEGLETFEDKEEDLKPRPPIITVMGHVDHGKTSLLDAIRKTNVTSSEAGGITQHIGASEVNLNGQKIVFLDTPGHEAFTAMRARGALVTDIAVLVVAADDSVKPQTVESISHAKAAGVPIIVAINKIDKPGANPDRVKQDLTEHGILVEDWGGETICVPVSAKTGEGIVNLLEMILLQAEMLELKANPNRLAMGTVIEARLDKTKGPVATLLVTNGTLQTGMSVVAGTCSGKIRLMTNFKGDTIRKAGPATAVEILGLTEVPEAGDEFNALRNDKLAREIAEKRRMKLREEVLAKNASVTLDQLFSQMAEGEVKDLNLIIKADVLGSVGALIQSLEKLQNENVRVKIVHSGVGTITESDVMLANTSGAIIIGFNVRPSTAVTTMADRDGVEIRTYRIIYEVLDDIEAAMKGMLDPEYREVVLGKIEIRNTFKVPGVGTVGGAYVLEGKVQRNAQIRLVRDGIVIHEGKISSLKRFKDDAKEVAQGFECGIGIENYNDVKEGDIIEAFKMEEIERK
ncbi:MAG: translation initiation factor IF-2 [Firmicutes bacterium]|nr:translation initiation factor IF-2 [Bacillota bacterium]